MSYREKGGWPSSHRPQNLLLPLLMLLPQLRRVPPVGPGIHPCSHVSCRGGTARTHTSPPLHCRLPPPHPHSAPAPAPAPAPALARSPLPRAALLSASPTLLAAPPFPRTAAPRTRGTVPAPLAVARPPAPRRRGLPRPRHRPRPRFRCRRPTAPAASQATARDSLTPPARPVAAEGLQWRARGLKWRLLRCGVAVCGWELCSD